MKDFLSTSREDRPIWLVKCPFNFARCFQTPFHRPPPRICKIIISIDPLRSDKEDDSSSSQRCFPGDDEISMEVADCELTFRLTKLKNSIPSSVFSELSRGKLRVEGKIESEFEMKPSSDSCENYGKHLREKTSHYLKNKRQIKMIDVKDAAQHIPTRSRRKKRSDGNGGENN